MKIKNIFLPFCLSVSASSLFAANEVTLFAAGVNPDDPSTYYNIDQVGPTCWAASASNVVAHWQDHHAKDIPENTPMGQNVYNTFLALSNQHGGNFSNNFYKWWLGHHSAAVFDGKFNEGWELLGGYYADRFTVHEGDPIRLSFNQIKENQAGVREIAYSYIELVGNYRSNLGGETLNHTTDLSSAIYYGLSLGYAMTFDNPQDRHALTLYGASFDLDTNLVTSVYLVDSSGASYYEGDSRMVQVSVGVTDIGYGEHLTLLGLTSKGPYVEGSYSPDGYISDVYFLGNDMTSTTNFILAGIPEPSAFGLLAGLGAFALVASRRRK